MLNLSKNKRLKYLSKLKKFIYFNISSLLFFIIILSSFFYWLDGVNIASENNITFIQLIYTVVLNQNGVIPLYFLSFTFAFIARLIMFTIYYEKFAVKMIRKI